MSLSHPHAPNNTTTFNRLLSCFRISVQPAPVASITNMRIDFPVIHGRTSRRQWQSTRKHATGTRYGNGSLDAHDPICLVVQ